MTDMAEMGESEDTEPLESENDCQYFDSYAGVGVHRMMLGDRARTEGYRKGIEAIVKPGMVVLDVGAGTGILSFFAARAGAKTVYAVDRSDILAVTEELVEANNFQDVIKCIDGVAENIELPEKVDVIVSEWMGMFALTEAMFESVVRAAKKHLKPGGVLIPGGIRICLTAIQDDKLYNEEGLGFWTESLYGFDYSPMINAEISDLETHSVDGSNATALAPSVVLADLDCHTAEIADYWFNAEFSIEIEKAGRMHGFYGHFEAILAPGVVLSTYHKETMTHWRQSWFPLKEREVEVGDLLAMRFRAKADPTGMDPRKPIYFMEGEWTRGGKSIDKFYYCHHGTYE